MPLCELALWWQACRLHRALSCSRHGCLYRNKMQESSHKGVELTFADRDKQMRKENSAERPTRPD